MLHWFVKGATYNKGDADHERIMNSLMAARASDQGKPMPKTPAVLTQVPPPKPTWVDANKFDLSDAEDAADTEGGSAGGYWYPVKLCGGAVKNFWAS